MKKYYADLRAELAERIEKARARGDETESLRLRQDALNREEALRLDELTRKAQIQVNLNWSISCTSKFRACSFPPTSRRNNFSWFIPLRSH